MKKVLSNGFSYYAVFEYQTRGRFWQQMSKWYFRKACAVNYMNK